jgi:DNA-binding CsgD family transcriptional regulator
MGIPDGVDGPLPGAEVLSAEARALYLRALGSRGRAARLHRDDTATFQASALQELLDVGLLVPDVDEDPDSLVAVDPRQISAALSSAWQTEAMELLSRSVALPAEMRSLVEAYEEGGNQPESGGAIEYVHGKVEINQRLMTASDSGCKEMLTAQPGGGRRSVSMPSAIDTDVKLMRRGVVRRTIYQPSARYHAPTRQYVEVMTREGGHVRTLGEPFVRLIIIDRSLAVIPVSEDTGKAAFIRDEAVVGYLISVFEGMWERAIPFVGDRDVPPQVVTRLRRNIVRLMLEGVGHRAIARGLGLSERTLARHIAEMREEFEVETQFQLGWKMAQRRYDMVDGSISDMGVDQSQHD